MKKEYETSLFIFRRDLRLYDNTGLIAAVKSSQTVIPCFIFDPRQVGSSNDYRSMNAIQFMIESLEDLQNQLKKKHGTLYLFHGDAEKIVARILKAKKTIDAVYFNMDYTPFSKKRDAAIEKLCKKMKIACNPFHDALLNPPDEVMTKSNKPYAVFTPFFRASAKRGVDDPVNLTNADFFTGKLPGAQSASIFKKVLKKENPDLNEPGGRAHGLRILKHLKEFKDYSKERDYPAIPTTHLSAHLKFGTISIRETRAAIADELSPRHPLIRQLYWRDFWTYVLYHNPRVYGHSYHEKYDKLWWSKSKKDFDAWCQGLTGFPIVDAGMRQLNSIGFMHNRVRMIVASFLTKDLHINWEWGEKYFAQQLSDYDPALNNGNWQWSASTGCDAQPYFRIFNPWLQQKKFDPHCDYIKEWVPELKDVENRVIHTWYKEDHDDIPDYPRPMVNHEKESTYAKKLYKAC